MVGLFPMYEVQICKTASSKYRGLYWRISFVLFCFVLWCFVGQILISDGIIYIHGFYFLLTYPLINMSYVFNPYTGDLPYHLIRIHPVLGTLPASVALWGHHSVPRQHPHSRDGWSWAPPVACLCHLLMRNPHQVSPHRVIQASWKWEGHRWGQTSIHRLTKKSQGPYGLGKREVGALRRQGGLLWAQILTESSYQSAAQLSHLLQTLVRP